MVSTRTDRIMNRTATISNQPAAQRRGGFTLVEMIVVIVILSVLAGVTTVRMTNTLPRRGRVMVQRVQNVLDTLAHRQVASQAPVALVYDSGLNQMWVERLESTIAMGLTPDTRPAEGQWKRDNLTPPVTFERDITLEAALFDGQLERGSFRVEVAPNRMRPNIELDIAFGDTVETVTLLPSEMRSMTLSEEATRLRLTPEDLNAQGAGDERW